LCLIFKNYLVAILYEVVWTTNKWRKCL